MAYYKKNEILAYIKSILERAKNSEIRIVTDPQEAARLLGLDEDLVAIFWVEQNKIDGSDNIEISLEGKVFVKIDFDLYSDDRYAIDSYQACKEGTTVSEIVKKREKETEETKSKLTEEGVEKLKQKIKNIDLFNKKD